MPNNPTGSVWQRKATQKQNADRRQAEETAKLASFILSEHKLLNGANYVILKPAAAWGCETAESSQNLRAGTGHREPPRA